MIPGEPSSFGITFSSYNLYYVNSIGKLIIAIAYQTYYLLVIKETAGEAIGCPVPAFPDDPDHQGEQCQSAH